MAKRKTKAVLVGCGGISNAWLGSDSVQNRVEIIGLVDIRTQAALAQSQKYGHANAVTGTDLNSVLRETRPDVVFDCSVPQSHCPVTLAALRHGCYVMGKKPMSDTMPNARRMAAAQSETSSRYTATSLSERTSAAFVTSWITCLFSI